MGTQTAVAPRGTPGASTSPIMSFVPMLVVVGILYMLIIRPQQQQAKEHRRLVDSLKPGDKVLTQGGIYGTVVSLKGQVVQVKIADNVRVDLNRSAVSQVVTETPSGNGVVTSGDRASS